MSGHSDEDDHSGHGEGGGHGGHHGFDIGQWIEVHISGIVVPVGQMMERFIERTMVLSVNGLYTKMAAFLVVVMTPVLLLEFVLHTVRL